MKKGFISTVITLLLVILITGIGLAARPRAEASGAFMSTSTTIHSVTDDKFNTIIELSSTVTYTGTLEGTSTLHGTMVVHHNDSSSFKGEETFIGLVNGIPGTLTFQFEGSSDPYQAIQINNIITSGTGVLSELHGELSKAGIIKDNGPVGTYTGQISYQD